MENSYPLDVIMAHEIASGVFVEDHQHWAMNSYAGEGKYKNFGDSSGCLVSETTCYPPKIAIYRRYYSELGKISCFLSYPNGMGHNKDRYFWEIYCLEGELFEDVERFDTEQECHNRIIKLLENTL